MPSADVRHEQAGSTPPSAQPTRPRIVAAQRHGDTLVTSGQTAVSQDGNLVATGRVGVDVDLETARRCAWQCAANVLTAAKSAIGSLDQITALTKLTVFVASAPDFIEQHLVADAATVYMQEVLGGEAGIHARSAIGVATLPTGSPVEIEATFRLSQS